MSYINTIRDSHELVSHYKSHSGGHFFDADTMRAFGSRVLGSVFHAPDGLIYFVTSERGRFETKRLYTVRVYNPANGKIGTPQEKGFGLYASRTGALANAKRFAMTSGDGWTAKYCDHAYFLSDKA